MGEEVVGRCEEIEGLLASRQGDGGREASLRCGCVQRHPAWTRKLLGPRILGLLIHDGIEVARTREQIQCDASWTASPV